MKLDCAWCEDVEILVPLDVVKRVADGWTFVVCTSCALEVADHHAEFFPDDAIVGVRPQPPTEGARVLPFGEVRRSEGPTAAQPAPPAESTPARCPDPPLLRSVP